jgi:hypothetical protein
MLRRRLVSTTLRVSTSETALAAVHRRRDALKHATV